MDGNENRVDLEVGRLRLIDVSSEDDCLIGSPSENQIVPDYFELSLIGNTLEREDAIDSSKEGEQDAMLSESLEQERTRKAGCNLRKSLAWDTAFFTSAGVLDHEELSIIHCGLKKADTHPLPGILEDVRRSAESNSTLDSDNFTLESLEVGLFDDIRASIQKSSKATNAASHSGKALTGESGVQTSRKTGIPPRDRMKPISVSKGQSINTQIQDKTKRVAIIQPRVIQATAKPGETNSASHKPPKIIARANSSSAAPTKRTSLGANRATIGKNSAKAISGRGQTVVLQQPSTNNMSVTSSSSQKSSSDSSSSATKVKSAASFVHHTRSGSASSDSTGKLPLKSLKNKKDSRDANRPSGSTPKAPLSIPSKIKTDSRNARVSAYLVSMSKPNSMSPASSIDGWSTESSSSTSTINQRSNNSKKNADISSPRKGFSSEREARQTLHLQTNSLDQSGEHESQGTRIPSESAKKQPLPSAAISHTASKDVSKSFKPSGLRMPSPKIGFFDAEKSAVRTPTSGLQCNPGERSCSPKSGAKSSNLTGGALKGKPTKHQSSRTSTVTGSINFDACKAGVRFSALSMRHTSAQPQELSNASPKPSSNSSVGKDRHGRTLKVKNDASHSTGQRSPLKPQDEDNNADNGTLNSVFDARESCHHAMNDSMGMKSVVVHTGYEITHAEEDGAHLSSKAGSGSGSCNYDDISPSDNSSENTRYAQDQVESKFHSCHNSNEMENSFYFEDQGDGLSRHVGVIDLNMDELIAKKSSSLSSFNVDDTNNANSGDPKLALSNFSKLLVHGQDFPKALSKSSPLSPPGSLKILHSTRTPLASKPSSCNGVISLEPASESTTEKASAFPFLEASQKDNS